MDWSRLKHTLRVHEALKLVWGCAPGWTLASAGLVVVEGLLPLLSLYFLKRVVDSVAAGIASRGAPEDLQAIFLFIGLTALAGLLTSVGGALAGLVAEVQSQQMTDHIQHLIQEKSLRMDLAFYENSSSFDKLYRAQWDAQFRPARIVQSIFQFAQNALSLAGIAALLIAFHWLVGVILLAAMIPGLVARLRLSGSLYDWNQRCTPLERMSAYLHWLLTGEPFAKEARLFQYGGEFMNRYREVRKNLREERTALSRRRTMATTLSQSGGVLVVYGCYAWMAWDAVHGGMTLGALVMFAQAFQRAQGYFQSLLNSLALLYEDSLFLTSFHDFMALKPRIVAPAAARPLPAPFRGGLVFEDVSFAYPGGPRVALQNINLRLGPRERIALVGPNGSGKTTLTKLLCRLYDPTGGRITLDGEDLREFDPAALHRQMTVIFQDFSRYHLSAAENIRMGNMQLELKDDRIETAGRLSRADEAIRRLKNGYATTLGRYFKDGEELSQGEWQKVALARAFASDAQIVILDEPTSFLDSQTERDVFAALDKWAADRALVYISHRLSSVRNAHRIYVLDSGRIVESGTHDELVARNGLYARMYSAQAAGYQP